MNQDIVVSQVRLVDENGVNVGVVDTVDAMKRAVEAGLDLVEVSPHAKPPVCKILDYNQLRYEKKRQKKKQTKAKAIKEVKFRPVTDIGDYNVKVKRIIGFLQDGHKVKAVVFFKRRREMSHMDLCETLVSRIKADVAAYCTLEQEAKSEGRQVSLVFAPSSK